MAFDAQTQEAVKQRIEFLAQQALRAAESHDLPLWASISDEARVIAVAGLT